jgi:hypothetical protein
VAGSRAPLRPDRFVMDHYSILDQSTHAESGELSTSTPTGEPATRERRKEARFPQSQIFQGLPGSAATAPAMSLAAGHLVSDSTSENSGQSLAEMAQRDLDATLQLLAERAQYITGASGAAIALRNGDLNDMLCRASAGANAPELGAMLSAEFGLSGESVRTRSPLRCDNVESDARVNRDGCRRLGIASVAVMPIVSDDEVLGVFELFSGKVNAFEERDLSTLQRLSGMVETAVHLAQTAQAWPEAVTREFVAEVSEVPTVADDVEGSAIKPKDAAIGGPAAAGVSKVADLVDAAPAKAVPAGTGVQLVVEKKPLLWSVAASAAVEQPRESDQSHLPPVLRNLRTCQACGFPVSEGRTLCVECEEKQWRGMLHKSATASKQATAGAAATVSEISRSHRPMEAPSPTAATTAGKSSVNLKPVQPASSLETVSSSRNSGTVSERSVPPSALPKADQGADDTLPFLSAGVSSPESWFSANKYMLGAIVLVAIVVVVLTLLR